MEKLEAIHEIPISKGTKIWLATLNYVRIGLPNLPRLLRGSLGSNGVIIWGLRGEQGRCQGMMSELSRG